jgi:protein-tyrosine phosphatase
MELQWDGCINVRDLGGHERTDGRETRSGSIVRADSLRQLSREGWAALVDYGVRTIIDLRTDGERAADPPGELPVDVVHISVMDDDDETNEVLETARSTPQFYLFALDRFRDRFAQVITAVAGAPPGAVAVHCQAGKDRTGLIAALLLRLAGVSIEVIAADYGLSAANLAPRLDVWLAGAADDEERERMRSTSLTEPEYMVEVLTELDRRFGGVEAYLLGGGASDEALAAARRRLVPNGAGAE